MLAAAGTLGLPGGTVSVSAPALDWGGAMPFLLLAGTALGTLALDLVVGGGGDACPRRLCAVLPRDLPVHRRPHHPGCRRIRRAGGNSPGGILRDDPLRGPGHDGDGVRRGG